MSAARTGLVSPAGNSIPGVCQFERVVQTSLKFAFRHRPIGSTRGVLPPSTSTSHGCPWHQQGTRFPPRPERRGLQREKLMKRFSVCVLAVAAVLSLPACGGGGDSVSEREPTIGEIRELTGLSAPVETAAAQQARQREVVDRTDSLVLSTMHMEVDGPNGTSMFRLLAECSGAHCELLDPASGSTDMVDLDTSRTVRPSRAEAIGSAHGITLTREITRNMGVDEMVLGAWMEHGSFGLNNLRTVGEEVESNILHTVALGDLTDRPLTGSATWLGIMVGTPTAGNDEGDRLVGTASLNYEMDAGVLDAAFGNIRNIDRERAHSVEAVIFANLAVGPDGTFATGQSGTRIQGGFHGPGHVEAAGIFEQSDIVGAFGVKRQ